MWRLDWVPKQGRTSQIKFLLANFEGDVWLCHTLIVVAEDPKEFTSWKRRLHHGRDCAQKWPWPRPQWAQNLIWYTFSDHIHSTYPSTVYLCHTPSLLFLTHNLLKKVCVCVCVCVCLSESLFFSVYKTFKLWTILAEILQQLSVVQNVA
jgi:hypothetical protein